MKRRLFFYTVFMCFIVIVLAPAITLAAPKLFFSDLESGPNTGGENNKGVFVTISGKNFGATRGASFVTVGGGQADNYPLWSDTKIIFQLGAGPTTGNIAVTTGAGQSTSNIPFTVRAGNIYFVAPNGTGTGGYADPMSPSAAYTQMGPGKIFYFRGGTYNQNYSGGGVYGYRNYSFDPAHGGTAGLPMAMIGYPNETAVFQYLDISRSNIGLSNGNGPTSYVTFANFTLHGGSACFEDGGFYTNPKSGGVGIRLIGNVMDAAYGNANTMTGVVLIQNDYWRVLGNELKDTGSGAPINNNHGIYNQAAASATEIAWNYFHDLRMGGVIQVHTDPYYVYTNVRIHDNVIAKGANGDSRGITIGNALTGTYGSIYNNIFDGIGQNFAAIGMGSGDWKVYNNTFYNIYATEGMVFVSNLARLLGGAPADWAMPSADIKNNIFYSDGQSPYATAVATASMSQVTLSNNLYYNFGAPPSQDTAPITGNPLFVSHTAGDFHLQSSSPAIDTGSLSVAAVVTKDFDGNTRPMGAGYDIGAYEYNGPAVPMLQFSSATYSVSEGTATATISVTRIGGSSGAVAVSYATSNGTATAGSDYTSASGTLNWADTDAATKTFAVPITNDTVVESDETINLTLSNPTNGAVLGTPSSVVLTITDNDSTGGGGDSGGGSGGGCGFVKDDGKGQKAKGEGLSFAIMLVIALTGIALAKQIRA